MFNDISLLIFSTLALVALIDYIPRLFVSAKKSVHVPRSYTKVPRYLIMPTVYGDISYLQNIAFLRKYTGHVVICTSKYETPQFYSDLRKVCRKYHFRYITAELPKSQGQPIKNAYTIYRGAFAQLGQLGARKDTPCLLMDADTYANDNVNHLMRRFKKSNLDIASLRCEVATPRTIIEKLQEFEYRIAMDNRRMDPWLTSGACSIAKASVFQHVFSMHSNFFAGGDIEIGKIARISGYAVKHIDFTFFTAAPNTFSDWFNQRTIWFAGGIRHHVTNMGTFGWHHFFMLFYNSLILYLLLPVRWIEIISYPVIIPALILLAWVYTAVLLGRRKWRPYYLLLPLYSFFQSMVIMPVAVMRYVRLCKVHRSVGLIKYDLAYMKPFTRTLGKGLNYTSVALIVFVAYAFTESRWDYWAQHGYILHTLIELV